MNDLPNVGTIVIVDADTIGRVMKTDSEQIVVHCLGFPFFRVIKSDTYDTSVIKVADDSRKAIQQLILPFSDKDWSIGAWEEEVETLSDYVLDDIDDDLDDTLSASISDAMGRYLRKKCIEYCRTSDWITNSDGQEKCVKYSINYLDVSVEDILGFCPEKERHLWTSVRKASAIAHLVKDVYEQVLQSIKDNEDDEDNDDEDSSDDD